MRTHIEGVLHHPGTECFKAHHDEITVFGPDRTMLLKRLFAALGECPVTIRAKTRKLYPLLREFNQRVLVPQREQVALALLIPNQTIRMRPVFADVHVLRVNGQLLRIGRLKKLPSTAHRIGLHTVVAHEHVPENRSDSLQLSNIKGQPA